MKLDPKRHAWMTAPQTRAVIAALGEGNARFVGGAVRNALLGMPVDDIDIATPLMPDEVTKRLQAAGIKAVPTGIEHGTVTAVANGKPFEVTTLAPRCRDRRPPRRRRLHDDWAEDAQRRDFTMNALYAAPDGEMFDTVGGVARSESRPRALRRRSRRRASAKIICASCACSASTPGTARARSTARRCKLRGAESPVWRSFPASACRKKCCACWKRKIPCRRCA